MKLRNTFIAGIILIVMLGASCNIINPAEPIPSYIHIPKIDITYPSSFALGDSTSKITDAWVYVDDNPVGCYQLPATFPVLYNGNRTILVRPGIKVDGIAGIRSPYNYYKSYTTTANLQPGEVTNINPATTYTAYANFNFMEAFEGVGAKIDSSDGSTSIIQRFYAPNSNIAYGTSCGVAYITADKNFFECVSSESYALPKSYHDVFLEFDYKSSATFLVGVIAQPPYYLKTSALTINPSANWNKIYVYLTDAITSSPSASQFKIFFGMQDVSLSGTDTLSLMLDNIRLVY